MEFHCSVSLKLAVEGHRQTLLISEPVEPKTTEFSVGNDNETALCMLKNSRKLKLQVLLIMMHKMPKDLAF